MKKRLVLLVTLSLLFLMSACQSEVDKAIADFNSSDEVVRNTAIETITHMDSLPIEKLIGIVYASNNENGITEQMKDCAVQALIKIGDPVIEPTLEAYLEYLPMRGGYDYIVLNREGLQCGTIPEKVLISLKNDKIVSFLIDIIRKYPDNSEKIADVMITLAKIGGQQASDVIYEQFLKWVSIFPKVIITAKKLSLLWEFSVTNVPLANC